MPSQRRRNTMLSGLLALGLLAGVAVTTGPAQAASGAGPYFPEPAWDRKLSAASRFLILTNWASQAVLDKETGLVWERTPAATTHTWTEARIQCTSRTTGNRKGWRLPSVHELASLVDPSQFDSNNINPALPLGHPFTILQGQYWSATTSASDPAKAWGVTFNIDITDDTESKTGPNNVWCVRGGTNAEVY